MDTGTGLLVGLAIAVFVCVLIGGVAQQSKGRTGALWGFLALITMAPLWLLFYFGTAITDPSLYKTGEGWLALAFMVVIAVAVIFLIILATLPSLKPAVKKADQPHLAPAGTSGGDKTCPFCAETIKAAALLCRFCGRDLPDGNA